MRRAFEGWKAEAEAWYSAVGIANMVMGTSSILVPLMIAKVLDGTVEDLGVLSSLVSLVGVIGSLIWGRLSDAAHRRKPFVILSFAVAGIGFAGIAFSPSFGHLLFFNMILNFFWVAQVSVSVLLVIENSVESLWERKIGHMNQIGALGWLAGLVLGSMALGLSGPQIGEVRSIRLLFLLVASGEAVACLLAYRLIPRTRPLFVKRRFRGPIVALGNFLVERARYAPFHLYYRFNPRRLPTLLRGEEGLQAGTRRFLFITIITFAAFGLFAVPLPLLLSQQFRFSSSTVFLCYVAIHVGIVLAYPLASRRIKSSGNKAVQQGSLTTRLIVFAAAAFYLSMRETPPPLPLLMAILFGIGITWSYFQLSGVTLASRLARPKYRSQTLGLYNAAAGLGTILAGVSAGYLAERIGYQAPFAAAAALLAFCLLMLRRLPVPPAGAEESPQKPAKDQVRRCSPGSEGPLRATG